MKDAERSVEAVLAGLREVATPVGMEQRILKAVEERVATGPSSRWLNVSTWLSGVRALLWAGSVAVAFAMALMVWMGWGHLGGLRGEHPALRATQDAAVRQGPSPAIAGDGAIKTLPVISTLHANVARASVVRRAEADPADESLEEREMRAASHPAPPMPLTEQERLLLRVAHKGDPVEIAAMNPEMRSRQVAQSWNEFQRFFEPTASLKAGERE